MDEIEYLGATSTIQSYNLFTYCEGNPVNMVDESGQTPIAFFLITLLVVTVIPTLAVVIASNSPKTTPKPKNKEKKDKDKDKDIVGPEDNWENAYEDLEEANERKDAWSHVKAILERSQESYQAQLIMFYQERYDYIDDLDPLW